MLDAAVVRVLSADCALSMVGPLQALLRDPLDGDGGGRPVGTSRAVC
jgi:hypothetical protein